MARQPKALAAADKLKAPPKPAATIAADDQGAVEAVGALERGVRAALENKYDAIVDLELALRARKSGTASDASVNAILDLLEDEADALNAVLDETSGPSVAELSPADAEALQNAIFKAETAIKQTGSVQSLLNAAAVLLGTLKQT